MALSYNQPRFAQNLLSKYKKSSPSFTINLYDDHWTLNKGPSKFLYTQPVSGLLDEVRALRIPVDFIEIFDMAQLPYYEGCMIVESIDHRKPQQHAQQSAAKEPECVRVVLQPTAESLYADLCLLNAKSGNKWTDREALEIESKILNATCPPLCLDPDINLTRIVNTVIRASTPSDSVVLKRKQVHEPEEDENDRAKRAKLWSQYMHPHKGKPSSQARPRSMFDILNEIAKKDEKGVYSLKWKPPPKNETTSYQPQGQPQSGPAFAPPSATSGTPASMPSTLPQEDQKPKKAMPMLKKPDTADLPAPAVPAVKGKKKIVTNANIPAAAPSPVPEQRNVGPVAPGLSRTTVDATAIAAKSPHPPPPFPLPQPSVSPRPPGHATAAPSVTGNGQKKRGVLKKPEDQAVQPPAHPQPQQPNSMDSQTTPWQPPVPSAQYLSQPPQKKPQPAQQAQQGSPFHAHTPVAGFANNNGYPQNAAYKNTGGMAPNPSLNPNRGSPMAHNLPLLSRDPLPSHSQSPRLPSQQPQPQQPSAAPQHPMAHPNHQYNMHLQQQQQQQNRYNTTMQAQQGHHPQPMTQHHTQPTNAARGAPGQHDPSQPMMHPQMQYNPMAFPYQMHMQGMMNGVRMANLPGGQGAAGGQYMPAPAWRVPPGRGGPPMTTIPMHNPQFQQQQQQMMATMNRVQQQGPQGQGR
ncbi:Spt20 family-domain-containing protein [Gautieria morchelliformis]|nr:Spt20 family-domain-containing protein [Gautieria morchelliformis]